MVNIFLIIIVLILLFFLVYALFVNTNKLLPISKMKYHRVESKNLADIISNNYYFSMWYNIQGIKNQSNTYNLIKWIKRGLDDNVCNDLQDNASKILIQFNQNLNQIKVKLYSSSHYPTVVHIHDVPLNGWNNIILSVNHNVVDVYINGELRKTQLSQQLGEHLTKGSRTLCVGNNDLHGYIGNIMFDNESLSTEDAYEIYKIGLGENPIKALFDKYRIKLAILEKNNELSSLEL